MEGTELDAALRQAGFALELFDHLPDVVAFVKDLEGRYAAINDALVERLGRRRKEDVLGRTTRDLFPAPLGDTYLQQDLSVLRSGRPLADVLELHLYPGGREGWCITRKVPVRGPRGDIIGLAGTSRDVRGAAVEGDRLADLAAVVGLIRTRYGEPLRVDRLAAAAGLSVYRFGRRIRTLFGLTPAQLIAQTRLDAARALLDGGTTPVAEIALACGYSDHSAFTRQFKRVVGLTPTEYRRRRRPTPGSPPGEDGGPREHRPVPRDRGPGMS